MTTDHDEAEQRNKLIRQLIYAASAVAVLLILLVVFNSLVAPPEEIDAPSYTKPVPVPKPSTGEIHPVTPPVAQSLLVDEPLTLPGNVSGILGAIPAIDPHLLPDEELPPPEPPPQPVFPSRTTSPPPVAQSSAAHPAQPVTPRAQLPPNAPPTARTTTVIPPPARPPVEDVPEGTEPPALNLPPEPKPASMADGFIVQAGVFSNPQRAEDLYAKLRANGIPASLETRVQAGPFRTQSEAQAARAKLKALGIDGVVLPPAARRVTR
ncbi:MAG: SPOR domain-containing protein [Zoogloeaceae bacterium]|jgi:cell division septation protein DedD|nr:SPOR domain-containing protein [Zoogloeaceae bacterium]